MLIETTLIAINNDSLRAPVTFHIPNEEWEQLNKFHRNVESLRSTNFVQQRRGGSVIFNWKEGEGLRYSGKQVEEDPVWAMLLKLRPFVLKNERCFLPTILKILKRRLDHVIFHQDLDRVRDVFFLKVMEENMPLRGQGRPPLSQQVVMDWLNSYHYHQDEAKRETVLADLGQLSEVQDGMSTILFALVDMIQSILYTGDIVETLQRCHEGTMPEIRFPAHYFDKDGSG